MMNNASRITLQHLNYLNVLVTEGHVSRAADKVGITQPAMSVALARLRELFNDPILVRTATGMQPTPQAIELAERAKIATELLSGGFCNAEAFDPGHAEGTFRILASDSVAEAVAPEVLSLIWEQAPKLRFTIRSGDIRRSAEYLRDGELEFVMGFTRNKPDDLYQLLLYPQRIVCLASRQHSIIRGSLTLDQFLNQGHVVWGAEPIPSPSLEELVDQTLGEKGLARNIVARVSSLSTSAALVARTDLLAVAPHRMATTPDVSSRCQALELPFAVERLDVQLLWHARWHRNPTHTWIRQAFRHVASDLQMRFGSQTDYPETSRAISEIE